MMQVESELQSSSFFSLTYSVAILEKQKLDNLISRDSVYKSGTWIIRKQIRVYITPFNLDIEKLSSFCLSFHLYIIEMTNE